MASQFYLTKLLREVASNEVRGLELPEGLITALKEKGAWPLNPVLRNEVDNIQREILGVPKHV